MENHDPRNSQEFRRNFLGILRNSYELVGILRNSQKFLGILRNSEEFRGISRKANLDLISRPLISRSLEIKRGEMVSRCLVVFFHQNVSKTLFFDRHFQVAILSYTSFDDESDFQNKKANVRHRRENVGKTYYTPAIR